MATPILRTVALALLALGSLLTLAGLSLVLSNSSNTPPVFVLMIGGGVILGSLGLVLLPFSRGRLPASPGQHPPVHRPPKPVAAPLISAVTVVLIAFFLIAVGLVAGFYYLIHRWFGDWNLW